MTASALIQLLQGVPPDTLVVVDTGAGGPMIVDSTCVTVDGVVIVSGPPLGSVRGLAQYQEQRKDATGLL